MRGPLRLVLKCERKSASTNGSELDLTLLGGVHLLPRLSLQEDLLDLLIEKGPGFGVSRVESIVIDKKSLMFEPVSPTALANLSMDSLPDLISEGSLLQGWSIVLAAATANLVHGVL